MDIHQVGKQAEYFEQPDDQDHNDDDVEDLLDLAVHGDVRIDKPKQNPCYDEDD